MTQILILNYGVGNLYSLARAIEAEGATTIQSRDIVSAGQNPMVSTLAPWKKPYEPLALPFDGLILPGVGNFTPVATKLKALRPQIDYVIKSGKPVLGVCLGMQILFDSSEEGEGDGLSLMSGRVVKLPSSVKTPQIGWNNLKLVRANPLVDGVPNESWVYFVHSFYPQPLDDQVVIAQADYGVLFPAVVARDHIFGTQFHPEKSGEAGRIILRNFLRLCQTCSLTAENVENAEMTKK